MRIDMGNDLTLAPTGKTAVPARVVGQASLIQLWSGVHEPKLVDKRAGHVLVVGAPGSLADDHAQQRETNIRVLKRCFWLADGALANRDVQERLIVGEGSAMLPVGGVDA